MDSWINNAKKRMKSKGTVGKFGHATEGKIAAGKRAGSVQEKRAVFAANMKRIAAKHKRASRKK